MGDRNGRPTNPMNFRDLVELTKKSIVAPDTPAEADDDPLADWDESVVPVSVAAGSQPSALPTTSRTATLSDPLTTGLLAEVARRTSTLEMDPETVQTVRRTREFDPDEVPATRPTQEIDPEKLERVRRDSQRTPAPEPVQPNIRRRNTTNK